MTLTEDKFSTSTQQMIYTISNKSSNIFSKWKEERGKGKEAREERREGREERKEKGREEKKVFEVDAASLWQWAKIPCLPGPGFLLVKCRQWCFLIGLLGSSCLANIIHWHYPHWYHLEMWANFRLWGPRMITNWSGPMGLYPAVFHSLQWTQCPLGLRTSSRWPPRSWLQLWGHEPPQQPGQRVKIPRSKLPRHFPSHHHYRWPSPLSSLRRRVLWLMRWSSLDPHMNHHSCLTNPIVKLLTSSKAIWAHARALLPSFQFHFDISLTFHLFRSVFLSLKAPRGQTCLCKYRYASKLIITGSRWQRSL